MFYKDVLIVDDSEPFCISIKELIEENGWSAAYTVNPEDGLKLLKAKSFKVVLLDLRMPYITGLDFLKELSKSGLIKRNYITVLTGEITIENAVDSLRLGAKDFIQKHAVVEYPEFFFERIEKGFQWQKERLKNEKLAQEKQKAIEESRLIVKSVGHDMSGSYYASLMLRLQMLKKQIEKIKNALNNYFAPLERKDPQLQSQKDNIIKIIDEATKKGDSIITLMTFFKELGKKLKYLGLAIDIDSAHKKEVNLNNLIKEALNLFRDSIAHDDKALEIKEDYSTQPLILLASEEDLVRVLVNLFENAYKAIGREGELSVTTQQKNSHAKVTIKDTGCGIPPDKLTRIWRPDYTQWEGKQGTGLGLMICKKVIENHEGEIMVESEVGRGTTFTITIELG